MNHSQGKAYEELAKIYNEKETAVKRWESNNQKIIGCIGYDVPIEILMAAGYFPVQITGDSKIKTPVADKYLEIAFDASVRAQFEKIVSGKYSCLERIVISNSSDVLIRLYYYMRQMRRVEEELLPIPLYFFDIKFSQFRSSTLYNRERVQEFIEAVQCWTGKAILPEAMENAFNVCNENRKLLKQMQELRIADEPKVTGTEALTVIGASLYMPKEEHNKLMKKFLDEAQSAQTVKGTRIYVSGTAHEDTGFYELLEGCGVHIVGEDHDLGSRLFMGPEVSPAYPVDSVTDFYQTRFPSIKKSHVRERVAAVVEQVKNTGAKGAIYFIRKSDDAASWDYPSLRKGLEAINVPVLLLDKQNYNLDNKEELQNKINEFITSISNQPGRE